jgi:3-oxoacyl-(acyl-carrier-protein) synthase
MRVAITGIGAVTAVGGSAQESFDAVCRGESGLTTNSAFPSPGPVAAIAGGPHRTSDLALTACREAVAMATLDDCHGMALVGASTSGDMVHGERAYEAWLRDQQVTPPFLWTQLCDGPTRIVARELGCRGPRLTVSTACTSGTVAVGVGAGWVHSGRAKRVLVFGADALCQLTVSGFASLDSVSSTGWLPFAESPTGLSLGEAAGAVVLEREDEARARNAVIYGFVTGFAQASDAHHMTAPHPEGRGARTAIVNALGGVVPDYVNAHGTGTPLNDAMERAVLAQCVPTSAISATKGATGHTLGAAGAIEAVFTVMALHTGRLPPNLGSPTGTSNWVTQTRSALLSEALTVNFAFGGHNAALRLSSDR